MAIVDFPPLETADENGLLAIGGDLEIPSLLMAYSRGIFPWPISEDFPLAWFSPDPRGVLFLEDLHLGRSLKRFIAKTPYRVTVNQQFESVIRACADLKWRKNQQDTWITPAMIAAYTQLHRAGFAFSIEIFFEGEEGLAGGLYGVALGHYVAGESMFYRSPNASKIALLELSRLCGPAGVEWIDTQMVTPVVESMGGQEIPRSHFIQLLQAALKGPHPNFFPGA